MVKRGAGKKVKKRPLARRFDLGEPGAVIRLEYPLGTRSETFWSFATPALLVIGGGLGAIYATRSFVVWIALGAIALGAALLIAAFTRGSGVLFLDGERLQIGPPKRTKDIALLDIQGMMRGVPGADPSGLEQLGVRFARAGKMDLAVALVPRASADELERRIALRMRAAATGDPRALEAVEARHLAGAGVIGVHLSGGAWRPFADTAELVAFTGAHPFRSAGERVTICVSPAVWEAITTIPDLVGRVEAIVVAD